MDGTVNDGANGVSDGTAGRYRRIDVPVSGGDLRVGVWDAVGEREGKARADVLLVHGVTASHRAWTFLVDRFPDVRFIAPDLRGRGRSNTLTGPAGLAAHADDLAAVLDALAVGQAAVVGHSMGAFVSTVFATRHPQRVSRLLLVDGGLPLQVPEGLDTDELVAHILGPTAARLSMRFADPGEYLDFWRGHPAFAADWTPELEDYLRYDLVVDGETLRPATRYAVVAEDTRDMNTTSTVADALAALAVPTRLITVPRGLQDEQPGLYRAPVPVPEGIAHSRLADLNHYTVVMSAAGAAALAPFVEEAVDGA